eukprot:TRINITY_DN7999_c0_g1_i1.p1 TRINITY_DN7999_c0_g1~~TRINITY_DN7999_c0_g1_i1.p1  ORF type:complete len:382 (-),score=43.92 TRINITY_DN7999_c0_g1_i1:52-1197(-)
MEEQDQPLDNKSVKLWTEQDVSDWLVEHNLEQYCELFATHKVDGQVLLSMTSEDLRRKPFQMPVLGDIKRVINLVKKIRKNVKTVHDIVDKEKHDDDALLKSWSTGEYAKVWHRTGGIIEGGLKLFLSLLYLMFVTFTTAVTMTIVHNRVPDQASFPPLPDIVLDNTPRIPWAFETAEYISMILGIIFILVLILHKHRTVILWRFCSITASVFLLRCLTMYVTSLSVPGKHQDCAVSQKEDANFDEVITRAIDIFTGIGMSLNGVRTCGDYMFSGHTIMVTVLNFFIKEYTPRSLRGLHILTWVLNAFGMFFILAGHEHYTVDVIIAFYVTTRTFISYHHYAASPEEQKKNGLESIQFIVPIFSFLENNSEGILPNEYIIS